ncbi:MAG: hypothetical protein ACI9R3_005687 [Verrucomicrobiales bacterium]
MDFLEFIEQPQSPPQAPAPLSLERERRRYVRTMNAIKVIRTIARAAGVCQFAKSVILLKA